MMDMGMLDAQRLREEFEKEIRESVTELARQLQLTPDELEASVLTMLQVAEVEDDGDVSHPQVRRVTLKDSGVEGGRSVKAENLLVDWEEILMLLGEGLLLATGMLINPEPITTTFGLLLLVRKVQKDMNIRLSEQEATVFWGAIQAGAYDKEIQESEISDCTNKERAKRNLSALSAEQAKEALTVLEKLKSVKRGAAAGTWRVIEKYKVEP